MRYGEIKAKPQDIRAFADLENETECDVKLPKRIDLEPKNVERGLVQLVLSVVELLRRLLEKQALRRIEGGSLTPEKIEELGETLMLLEQRMQELKDHFEIEDLNVDLGPLGKLLD